MKKNNESQVVEAELIPSTDMILRSGLDKPTLDRLVQQKVAESWPNAMRFVFEPFFRTRQVAYELKRLQTVPEQRKWSVSYERFGCMICETRKRIYLSNGMCNLCHGRWFARLAQIIAEEIDGRPAHPSQNALLQNGTTDDSPKAQALLPVVSAVHRRWNKARTRKPSGGEQ